MLAVYGNANGFGWQLNETRRRADRVGADLGRGAARRHHLLHLHAALCALFVVLYVVLNVMLSRMVIKPVTDLSAAADKVSTGDFTIAEFTESTPRRDRGLARSFNACAGASSRRSG